MINLRVAVFKDKHIVNYVTKTKISDAGWSWREEWYWMQRHRPFAACSDSIDLCLFVGNGMIHK